MPSDVELMRNEKRKKKRRTEQSLDTSKDRHNWLPLDFKPPFKRFPQHAETLMVTLSTSEWSQSDTGSVVAMETCNTAGMAELIFFFFQQCYQFLENFSYGLVTAWICQEPETKTKFKRQPWRGTDWRNRISEASAHWFLLLRSAQLKAGVVVDMQPMCFKLSVLLLKSIRREGSCGQLKWGVSK